MSGVLFKKELKSNFLLFVIFVGVLLMYAATIIYMFDPEMADSLRQMTDSMPELFAAFGMATVGENLLEFVANYLYGMIFLAFPAVHLVILGKRLVAGYVDDGSMSYLLATPKKRARIAWTQGVVMLVTCVLTVAVVAAAMAFLAEGLFPGELDMEGFLRVNVCWLGVLVFFGGICFLCSCIFNQSRHAVGCSAAVVVYAILLQMLSQVGESLEKLRYLTPLTLFDIDGLVAGTAAAWFGCVIFYAAGAACMAAGVVCFNRKNLPL